MVEKLTDAISVRLTDDDHEVVRYLALSQGMKPTEWVRSLIDQAVSVERSRYEALSEIFGPGGVKGKQTSE